MLAQRTLSNSIKAFGIGLHSGEPIMLKLMPAAPDTGIIFRRVDLDPVVEIKARAENVGDTTMSTSLTWKDVKISTVEHLLSAMAGLGIDNAIVEIDNQEVPILDGSANLFVKGIRDAGMKSSGEAIKIIKINNKINVMEGDKYISIDKSNVTGDIEFEIKYKNKLIGIQKNKVNVFEDDLSNIFCSRTFCLYEDIEKLKKLNLGLGGSLENAIVVKDQKVLNESGLRNNLEFVNHKILDCMGDLFLSGYRMVGSLKTCEGGHGLTNKILRKLFSDKSNFKVIEIKEKTLPYQILDRSYLKSIA